MVVTAAKIWSIPTLTLSRNPSHRMPLLNNAGRVVDEIAKLAQPPSVLAGVTTPYGSLPVRTGAIGPTRKDYSIVVPYLTPVDTYVFGAGVDFEDDKGRKATNQTLRISLRLKPGDPPKSEVGNVTGLKGSL